LLTVLAGTPVSAQLVVNVDFGFVSFRCARASSRQNRFPRTAPLFHLVDHHVQTLVTECAPHPIQHFLQLKEGHPLVVCFGYHIGVLLWFSFGVLPWYVIRSIASGCVSLSCEVWYQSSCYGIGDRVVVSIRGSVSEFYSVSEFVLLTFVVHCGCLLGTLGS